MQQREVFKDADYFDDFVQFSRVSIGEYSDKIKESDTTAIHRCRLHYAIFKEYFHLIIAEYSRGTLATDLKPLLTDTLEALIAYQAEEAEAFDFKSIDDYICALWLVSFAILFDADDAVVHKIVDLIAQDGKDALFEKLVSLRIPGRSMPSAPRLLYAAPYKPLYEALDEHCKNKSELIEKFLQNYYKGMRKTYWHNNHLEEDAGFFGYWCFELAALVKCLDINDLSFADNIYYPRDLTGKKLFRTWQDSETGEADRKEYAALRSYKQ